MEYDLAPNGPTRTTPRPVTAQRTPAQGNQAPLLDLQRLAGNAAVSSAVKSGRFDSSVPVQRIDEQEAVDEEFEEEDMESEESNAEEAEAEQEQEEIQEESEG